MNRYLLVLALVVAAHPWSGTRALAQTTLIASYPLNGTAEDDTGNYDPMELINAPFEDGGIYLNGNYVGGASDSSHAATPLLTGLDLGAFTIQVDFKIAEYPPTTRPVIIGGSGWRWGGASLTVGGNLQIHYNNTGGPAGDQVVSLDVWHTLVFTYDGVTGNLYMDDTFITSKDYILVHGEDRNISPTNGGTGRNFKGHIRNLEVYNGVLDIVPVEPRSWGSLKTLQ
jgi:hypothetical protein